METVIIDNNLISEIDVTNNSSISILDISDCPNLTSADLRNDNNINITGFYSTGNPNLYCINVDDCEYSTSNWNNILDQHYFSEDCNSICGDNIINPNNIVWLDPDWEEFDWDTYWDDLDLGNIVDWNNIPWDLIIESDMQPEDLIYYIISQNITLNEMPFIWDEFIKFNNSSSIIEKNNVKMVIHKINILGKIDYLNSLLIEIYNDGSAEKKYIIK